MKKKLLTWLLVLGMVLSLASCSSGGGEEEETPAQETQSGEVTADTEWAIYWYLCGSDLETNGGFATTDLQEMLEVQLPENVKIVIETGGSQMWHNDTVDASALQRYVYDSTGLNLVDEQPSASMGDSATLASFLSFAAENYPAEKTAVVFWNHGGGSVAGAAFDELYGHDSLTLDEMYAAFSSVWELSAENPPLELIGFDTCLMATVDVAYTFSDIGKYLVASEETEPGNGWYYSGWIGALAADPSIDGVALGTVICDTYYEGCELAGTQDSVTLSLTDLSKLGGLLDAYENFGSQALAAVCQDAGFISQFGRIAASTENYGGNTKEQGYTNMVDLGNLAENSAESLPEASQAVLAALDDCVLYRVAGQYRAESSGLSCFYSYNGDLDNFMKFVDLGYGTTFKYYYAYALTGVLDGGGMEYIEAMNYGTLPELMTLSSMGWDGMALDVDDEGRSVLTLGPDAYNILSGISFQLFYMLPDSDQMLLLGKDNDILADWDNGVFKDNFRGVWGAIDGCLVYMELSYEGEDYNLYSVPVLLNDEEYNLVVAYDFTEEAWSILGAQQGIDENGMADKELRLLAEGDVITTIHYSSSISGDDDFVPFTVDTITVTADTSFGEAPLMDGQYVMVFEMRDAQGNTAYSDGVTFDCADGQITTTVYE